MTDTPEAVRKTARVAYGDIEACITLFNEEQAVEAIASLILSEREAARAEERARCLEMVRTVRAQAEATGLKGYLVSIAIEALIDQKPASAIREQKP